jgi:aldehyde dehydrogenase (NAD(P)+)
LDAALVRLRDGALRWSRLPLSERAALLAHVHAAVAPEAARWAYTAAEVKGLDPSSPLVGEEWISGPYATAAGAGALAGSLAALAAGQSPAAHVPTRTAPGGRLALTVQPHDAKEWLLLQGFSTEVWMQPGVDSEQVQGTAGLGARTNSGGGVGLVLGAGNITSIAPLDVLYELVAHNRAVMLKLNPTLAALMTVYQAVLAPLIRFGVVEVVQGGAETGTYLVHHDGVDHVHITGSAVTHDAIVWGSGEAGRARRASGTALLSKPITSELGGVSPVIVVPGRWSSADLTYQAEHVVTQRLHNSGHNCIATQVVVVSRDWPQKGAFLAALRAALDKLPARRPWYPGTESRFAAALTSYPQAERHGDRLLIHPSAEDAQDLCSTEYFGPVLGVVELPGADPRSFLDTAVEYANDRLAGTLGANVLIAPAQLRGLGPGFEQVIAGLRYGTIAVNAWTGLGFLTARAPWGAYPGHTLEDVGSGVGVVHNALLLEGTERTVVRGPFRPFPRSFAGGEWTLFPKPPWFVTARTAATTGRRLTAYAGNPSWLRLPGIFASAFRA